MTFFPAPGVLEVALHGEWGAVIPTVSVFHLSRPGELATSAWDLAAINNALNRVSGGWQSMCTEMANDQVYNRLHGRDLTTEDALISEVPTAIAGASAAEPTGAFVGPIVQWKTGTAGRHNGRTFIPGVAEADMTSNGQISVAKRAALVTAANAFRTFLGAATDGTHLGAPLQLLVLQTKPPTGTTTRIARVVTSNAVPSNPGVQRRRLIGG